MKASIKATNSKIKGSLIKISMKQYREQSNSSRLSSILKEGIESTILLDGEH